MVERSTVRGRELGNVYGGRRGSREEARREGRRVYRNGRRVVGEGKEGRKGMTSGRVGGKS